ncbi:hypothetical protein GMORB2_5464 [Geosmithia morbida]|uniref:Uncharacterized protein n=1 Tax=Geosmithia morbida TaxID=1094350 RepID=A0A9P4Z028_9HYPO|nr:uncharacterized protein GMORB2_5464 [Geosmithia morbida]KAF4124798.1 hypothetical protein GMORB2_5464 [Geosmithia morbida]
MPSASQEQRAQTQTDGPVGPSALPSRCADNCSQTDMRDVPVTPDYMEARNPPRASRGLTGLMTRQVSTGAIESEYTTITLVKDVKSCLERFQDRALMEIEHIQKRLDDQKSTIDYVANALHKNRVELDGVIGILARDMYHHYGNPEKEGEQTTKSLQERMEISHAELMDRLNCLSPNYTEELRTLGTKVDTVANQASSVSLDVSTMSASFSESRSQFSDWLADMRAAIVGVRTAVDESEGHRNQMGMALGNSVRDTKDQVTRNMDRRFNTVDASLQSVQARITTGAESTANSVATAVRGSERNVVAAVDRSEANTATAVSNSAETLAQKIKSSCDDIDEAANNHFDIVNSEIVRVGLEMRAGFVATPHSKHQGSPLWLTVSRTRNYNHAARLANMSSKPYSDKISSLQGVDGKRIPEFPTNYTEFNSLRRRYTGYAVTAHTHAPLDVRVSDYTVYIRVLTWMHR